MGWLIALGILALLAVLPLGVSVKYDSDGPLVRLIVGLLKITLFPRPKTEKKRKKEKKSKDNNTEPKTTSTAEKPTQTAGEKSAESAKKAEPAPEADKKKSGGPVTDFLPLVKTVVEMLGAFRRRLRVNVLEVKVVMAGGDPADLGINYGRAWTAIGNFQPYLEKFLVIKKRKIEVECDFCADQTLVTARLDLTITLGRILATVVYYGVKALIQFLKINKKRKGGAAK